MKNDILKIINKKYEKYSIGYSKIAYGIFIIDGLWCGTVVERRSLAGELSLSCARPAADG